MQYEANFCNQKLICLNGVDSKQIRTHYKSTTAGGKNVVVISLFCCTQLIRCFKLFLCVNANVSLVTNYTCILPMVSCFCWYVYCILYVITLLIRTLNSQHWSG